MTQSWQLSAETMATQVRSGELSAVEIFDACLERSRAVEPTIDAYLSFFDDEGRQRARDIDQRCQAGEDPGPLAGVPVAIKDNIAVAERTLSCGSRMLDSYVAPESATAVERLEAAGAIILGKCNLDEYAMGSSCENSALQTTRNPWNRNCVPGGSSGGPAAAVATAVPVALGSDTGGSIRQPAAFCGVVGLKPTWGRVSRYGLVAFTSSTDQIGPLSRSVRDSALTLSIIAGPDPRDSTSAEQPLEDPLATIEDGIDGLRVGIARQIDTASLAPDSQRAWSQSLQRLEELGAELHELSIPTLEAAIACYYVLSSSEASANLARFDGVRYGHRTASAHSLAELYAKSRSEGLGAEVKRRIMLGTFALSAGYFDAYYGRALEVREAMRREMTAALDEVDILVTPTAPTGAFELGERVDDPLAMYLSDIYTTPASLTGLPALSLPCGRDDRGLPLGFQIMAAPFDETTLLRVGRAFEKAGDWRVDPAEEDV